MIATSFDKAVPPHNSGSNDDDDSGVSSEVDGGIIGIAHRNGNNGPGIDGRVRRIGSLPQNGRTDDGRNQNHERRPQGIADAKRRPLVLDQHTRRIGERRHGNPGQVEAERKVNPEAFSPTACRLANACPNIDADHRQQDADHEG